MRRGSWMLVYGIGLYLITGTILLVSPEAMGITAMGEFNKFHIDNSFIGLIFILCGILTCHGLLIKNPILAISLCFPQLTLLAINSIACISAIFRGSYADGVIRPTMFILADQVPYVLAAILHMVAIIDIFVSSGNKYNKEQLVSPEI